jgi:hypothetical protein
LVRRQDVLLGARLEDLPRGDLTSPLVRTALAQRYGKATIPLDSVMIAPQQIFDSELLETVRDDRPASAQAAQ